MKYFDILTKQLLISSCNLGILIVHSFFILILLVINSLLFLLFKELTWILSSILTIYFYVILGYLYYSNIHLQYKSIELYSFLSITIIGLISYYGYYLTSQPIDYEAFDDIGGSFLLPFYSFFGIVDKNEVVYENIPGYVFLVSSFIPYILLVFGAKIKRKKLLKFANSVK